MLENTQHYHRCKNQDCTECWLCSRVNCGTDEMCDACERRQFDEYHEQRGFTVAQPTIPEIAEALVTAHKEKS